MEKNIQEKKKQFEENHRNFVAQKNKELEALNLDQEDYNLYVLEKDPQE